MAIRKSILWLPYSVPVFRMFESVHISVLPCSDREHRALEQ